MTWVLSMFGPYLRCRKRGQLYQGLDFPNGCCLAAESYKLAFFG
jgi:hypothetical protein